MLAVRQIVRDLPGNPPRCRRRGWRATSEGRHRGLRPSSSSGRADARGAVRGRGCPCTTACGAEIGGAARQASRTRPLTRPPEPHGSSRGLGSDPPPPRSGSRRVPLWSEPVRSMPPTPPSPVRRCSKPPRRADLRPVPPKAGAPRRRGRGLRARRSLPRPFSRRRKSGTTTRWMPPGDTPKHRLAAAPWGVQRGLRWLPTRRPRSPRYRKSAPLPDPPNGQPGKPSRHRRRLRWRKTPRDQQIQPGPQRQPERDRPIQPESPRSGR